LVALPDFLVNVPIYTIPMLYSGVKQAAYVSALSSMMMDYTEVSSSINAFMKVEKVEIAKLDTNPRAIQYRGKQYNLCLGQYIKAIENALYVQKFQGVHIFAKSRNVIQRASDIKRLWEVFGEDTVCISIDCSRWDQHHSYELLQLEHMFYTSLIDDPLFKRLLLKQLKNRGKFHGAFHTRCKYLVRGLRMSGDSNTALGNCVTMYLLLCAGLRGFNFRMYDDGDDCLVFIHKKDLECVKVRLKTFFAQVGHNLKLETIAYTIQQVRFCKSGLINYGDIDCMIRDPMKSLATILISKRNPLAPGFKQYLSGVARQMLVVNRGVPVVEVLCRRILSFGFDEGWDCSEVVPWCMRGVDLPIKDVSEQIYSVFGAESEAWIGQLAHFVFPSWDMQVGVPAHSGGRERRA
jgi:hypothetical protein